MLPARRGIPGVSYEVSSPQLSNSLTVVWWLGALAATNLFKPPLTIRNRSSGWSYSNLETTQASTRQLDRCAPDTVVFQSILHETYFDEWFIFGCVWASVPLLIFSAWCWFVVHKIFHKFEDVALFFYRKGYSMQHYLVDECRCGLNHNFEVVLWALNTASDMR